MGRSSVDIIKSGLKLLRYAAYDMPIADHNLFYFFTLGGYKLSALEIERILLEHEDIKECAVVGVSDEKWGEKVCMIAAFNGKSSLSVDQLRSWAKPKMASYKIPSTIIKVTALPRNQMGKINKKQLKKDFNIV